IEQVWDKATTDAGKQGLNDDSKYLKVIDGVSWQLRLMDQSVDEGDEIDKNGTGAKPNSYEACFKFSYGNKTRYFAGGLGGASFATPDDVLRNSFSALCWVGLFTDQKGRSYFKIKEIVKEY